MSDTKISEAAPAVYGIRVKGNLAIVGVLPVPLKDFPVKNPEWDERYEEVPLYLHPQPAELAEQQGMNALAEEGLAYFERSGDEGDRKYVAAIRNALAATGKQQVGEVPDSASRLIDAIEGECDGLVISPETAAAILDHVRLGDPWRDAVFSEWALTFIDPQSEVPAEILRAVINWNVRTALDPSASSDAAALVASGKQVGEVQGDARAQFEAWANKNGIQTHQLCGEYLADGAEEAWAAWQAALAARHPGVKLAVWWGPMPESNGRQNWTAMLYRKGGDIFGSGSITIERSEYSDRVRYEADRLRYLIGELEEEPDVLKYDANLHSGYVEQVGEVQGDAHSLAALAATVGAFEYGDPEARHYDFSAEQLVKFAALAARQPVRIYGCCAQPEGELHTAECPNMRHIAARQPGAQVPVGVVNDGVMTRSPRDLPGEGLYISAVKMSCELPPGTLLYAAPPAQGIDLEKARDEGHDGAVRYVLGYLNGVGDWGSTQYVEILNACGRERIIQSAVQDGELDFTGLGRWVAERGTDQDRALIDQRDAAPVAGTSQQPDDV